MFNVDELKQVLQERAGLSDEQAAKAAQAALEFISERVPQVSGLLEQAGGADALSRRLGGLFGRRE